MMKTAHPLLLAAVFVFASCLFAQPKGTGKVGDEKSEAKATLPVGAKGAANSKAGGTANNATTPANSGTKPANSATTPANSATTPGNSANRAATEGPGSAAPAGKSAEVSTGKSDGKGKANNDKVDTGKAEPKGLSENASENAKAVQSVIEKFEAQRNQYLAERKVLLEKLKTASATEKKAIAEQLRVENQARENEERALAKQIREELKSLRGDRSGGGN